MKKNYLVYSFITVVLGIFVLDVIEPLKDMSVTENRKFRKSFDLTVSKFFDGKFRSEYEEYINDQFLFRDKFVEMKSLGETLLLKKENNGIIFGEDGRLFEKQFILTENDRENIESNIKSLNKFSENRDNVFFMLVPNSFEIYRDENQRYIPFLNQSLEINNIYKKCKYMKTLDVKSELEKAKDKDVFYKTDHHWNLEGAFVGYRTFIESAFKEVKIPKEELVKIPNFLGSYYLKGKPFLKKEDTLKYYNSNNIEMNINGEVFDELYNKKNEKEMDKYGGFINGNNSYTVVKNKNIKNGEKLLIIKDSFANSMVQYLKENYEEIHIIDLRTYSPSINEYMKNNNFSDILIVYNFTGFIKDRNLYKLKY